VIHIHGLSDIERAIAATAAQPDGGILAASDLTIEALAKETVAAVAQHGVPAIYPQRSFVMSGGLMYYGTDRIELYRSCASYVDRILRGEKPGDLPYQQPTKYELVINAKTAKTLGLSIPPRLLFTADEVIE
jgi:putative ABC transport system substrate-binding protein